MGTFDPQQIRQGLPRTPGGEPWPAGGAAAAVTAAPTEIEPPIEAVAAPAATPAAVEPRALIAEAPAAPVGTPASPGETSSASAETPVAASEADTVTVDATLRQGLPRTPGGAPWPPAGVVAVQRAVAPVAASSLVAETAPAEETAPAAPAAALPEAAPVVQTAPVVEPAVPAPGQSVSAEAAPVQAAQVEPVERVEPPASVAKAAKPAREPRLIRGRTLAQWAKLAVLWGGGAILAAAIIVLAARGLTTLPGVPEFLERYPGEYHSPVPTEDGFPVWARWAHFFNFFLMVLIIRSGLLVRHQQRPDAFYAPKKGGKKISIYLWLHTSLDLLWLLNGVAFVVLLFASGHWARIVPTSWEVFPNALSAGLQYLTLQWPVENGWVNYNSLQQLMYFTVVFIAAPLAAITGVRMSEWWPEHAERLNRLYPAPVARAIHYPTMLFFVLFILVHVFLVLTTGALKNLNHMFAGTPEVSWVGFWWFAGAVLVTAAVTWAARPLVLAPIAGLFGRVSER